VELSLVSTASAGIRFSHNKVLKKMDKESSGNNPSADVQTFLATLCYLMSRHAEHPAAELADIMRDHFSMMQSHPDFQSGFFERSREKTRVSLAQTRDPRNTEKHKFGSLEMRDEILFLLARST